MPYRTTILLLLAARAFAQSTEWKSGDGTWGDASKWSAGVPSAAVGATVGGRSAVRVPAGVVAIAGDLKIGFQEGDRARVEVDGGQLILPQDSLRVGEYTGGDAEFVLRSGAMHSFMDVFVGAASALDKRANHSTMRVIGGSFLARTITAGLGYGARSVVSVEGSRASAVHVLDYVYIEGKQGGDTTLAFALDGEGVTPITIQSRRDGLRIENDGRSHCRLKVALSASPPAGDIPLVASQVRTRGTFDDLPEGAEIAAEFEGKTYRWTLTYRGGLVLKAAGAHSRALPAPPAPLWREHPLYKLSAESGTPAFAGAEGFGAFTPGGRGGRVIEVTNLEDSGPGSLRAAVEASGGRTIAFRTGGVIRLRTTLLVKNPYLTIDGSGAPGSGILLRDHGIDVQTHDVVLRHFRIRIGDDAARAAPDVARFSAGDGETALTFSEGAHDAIADHLSLSWATGKLITITRLSDRITIQWCILSEGLNFAGHGYASLAGGGRVTWHHNLLAHNQSRNVRFQGPVDADFRNNVVYDWGDTAAYGESDRVNYAGNYLKPGPSTTQRPRMFHNGDGVIAAGSLYVDGNVLEGNAAVTADNWRGMGYEKAEVTAANPFPAPAITMQPAEEAYRLVLESAGARLPHRDAVDDRVVREAREGTGRIVKWVEEAGGWPEFR